ncbi:aconitate hydratase [Atractiella rhizophila]|nr:aconitate hydratase [Atractiella rhizophila]
MLPRRIPLIQRTYASHASSATRSRTHLIPPYSHLQSNLSRVRSILNRPLSLAEKIIYSHLLPSSIEELKGDGVRGEKYLKLKVDRVAMQDASAQMAILQFATTGKISTSVPASIHCDHLISAFEGAEADLKRAEVSEKEVFDFLESAAKKYGIEFWRPGSGIIHQIVLENYAAPGLMMLGTDSHTPNAGGLCTVAIGVGGADAVDALTDTPWELKAPKLIGVHLKGKLSGWTSPKDVILAVAGKLTVRGGTGKVIEYYGPGVETFSATGTGTICNMGAEVGATTSIFPYTPNLRSYLKATGRADVAAAADQNRDFLRADEDFKDWDEHVEIDLSSLEPQLNGPHTPDLNNGLSAFKKRVQEEGWKDEISAALIGSCTNSSYEDMSRVTSLVKQASEKGLKVQVPFLVTPGSELINATLERDEMKAAMENAGAKVLANACGPCIGQWERKEYQGEDNAILTSFNRNFKARNDGNRKTMNFLASPDIVTAMAFSGRLSFNPITDSIPLPNGESFRFSPPEGVHLPSEGFTQGNTSYLPQSMPAPQPETEIVIDPKSTRLELLEPFEPHWAVGEKREFEDLAVLIRIRGKCTTDEISAAGKWLKYKGHLSNIAENTLIGATNDETAKVNHALSIDGVEGTIPEVAKQWKADNKGWMVVTDFNYGEGSAREHAALQPRWLGCKVILARSFARIHPETNLKKQGVLPLTFANPSDYSKISAKDGDIVSTVGLEDLFSWFEAGKDGEPPQIAVKVTRRNGGEETIAVEHTLSRDQARWIAAGSALNVIRQNS